MSDFIKLNVNKSPKDISLNMAQSTNSINLRVESSGGTNNYERLANKPSINGRTLIGDKSWEELGDSNLTNLEIKEIIDAQFANFFN